MKPYLYLNFFLLVSLSADQLYGQPAPRHLEEIGYDELRKTLVVYGGSEPTGGSWIEPADIWEWDGNEWKSIDAVGPGGRRAPVIVYDSQARKILVTGGVAGEKDSVLTDTWSWDGRSWQLLDTLCPVKEPRGVYDPVANRLLVYGKAGNKTAISYDREQVFELWEHRQGSWKKLTDEGPDERPAQLTYDEDRKVLVIPFFTEGGVEMWEWNDAGWTKKTCDGDCPSWRTRFAIAYTPKEKASFLFGGLSAARQQLGDFWKWDGMKWQRVEAVVQPERRNSAHLVYGNDQLLLFGGSVPDEASGKLVLTNELWIWKTSKWSKK